MTQKYGTAQYGMLSTSAANPLSPHPERGGLHLFAHQVNHSGLIQAELGLDRLKCCSVLPSHLDNARDGGFAQGRSIAGAAFS